MSTVAYDETIAVPITLMVDAWDKSGMLIYRPSEPLSATLRIHASASRSVDWELSYDLFRVGAFSPIPLGPGRYRIRRWGDSACLLLPLPNRTETTALIKLFYVRKFLRKVVPQQWELDDETLREFVEGDK